MMLTIKLRQVECASLLLTQLLFKKLTKQWVWALKSLIQTFDEKEKNERELSDFE